jgi:hypothetical protein
MSPGRLALLLQLGTTLPMVGVIWLVQWVAYPLFAHVGDALERLVTHVTRASGACWPVR